MRALFSQYGYIQGMIQDYTELFRKYRGNARYRSRIVDFDNAQRPRSLYFRRTALHEVQKSLGRKADGIWRTLLSSTFVGFAIDKIMSKSTTSINRKKIGTRFSWARGRFSTFVVFVAHVIVALSEVLYVCIPYSSLFHRIYMLLCSHFRRAIFAFIRRAGFPSKRNWNFCIADINVAPALAFYLHVFIT